MNIKKENKKKPSYQIYIENGATLLPTLLFIPSQRHPVIRQKSKKNFFLEVIVNVIMRFEHFWGYFDLRGEFDSGYYSNNKQDKPYKWVVFINF